MQKASNCCTYTKTNDWLQKSAARKITYSTASQLFFIQDSVVLPKIYASFSLYLPLSHINVQIAMLNYHRRMEFFRCHLFDGVLFLLLFPVFLNNCITIFFFSPVWNFSPTETKYSPHVINQAETILLSEKVFNNQKPHEFCVFLTFDLTLMKELHDNIFWTWVAF